MLHFLCCFTALLDCYQVSQETTNARTHNPNNAHTPACYASRCSLQQASVEQWCIEMTFCFYSALPPGNCVFSLLLFLLFCCFFFLWEWLLFPGVKCHFFPFVKHLTSFVLDMLELSRSHTDPSNLASDLMIQHAAGFQSVIRLVCLCRCVRLHQFLSSFFPSYCYCSLWPSTPCSFLPAWTGSAGWSSVFCVAWRSGEGAGHWGTPEITLACSLQDSETGSCN